MERYKKKFKEARYMKNAWHVLPIGAVNLVTGKNKFLDVFEDEGEEGVLVLVSRVEYNFNTGQNENKGYKGIIGYKDKTQPLGWYIKEHGEDYIALQHDQNLNDMGNWKLEKEFLTTKEGFEELINYTGKKSLICAVMK